MCIYIYNIRRKNENVKFKKGETERILAYEYYQNSYNACFQLRKDISNESLKKNYTVMWNYVKNYSDKRSGTKDHSPEKKNDHL